MKSNPGNIVRVTSTIAAVFAVLVSLVVPAGHFIISYQYTVGSLESQAELNSRNITALVAASPHMWQFEQVRLSELLDLRKLQETAESRRILDLSGNVVAESSEYLKPPKVTTQHDIYDAGNVVARIEISRSLYPLVWQTVLIFMGSVLVSIFIFIALRNIPLRAIKKAYSVVEESETRYRTLYESMSEGVVLFNVNRDAASRETSLTAIDLNPSAELILKTERKKAIGSDILHLMGEGLKERLQEIVGSLAMAQSLSFEYQMSSLPRFLRVSFFSHLENTLAVLIEDVSEKKKSEEQIKKLAYYDVLTGLPNRQLLQDRLDHALARASRENGKVAVMFLDLDRFKVVNDTLGHSYGDLLLVQVSLRLRDGTRTSDTIARLGGDEFVVVLSYCGEELNAAHIAQHLLDLTSMPYDLGTRMVNTSASIGIAMFPDDALDSQSLLSAADLAMYAAKEAGRNSYNFFSQEMNRKAHERMELESSLREGVVREEFFLEFQPIVGSLDGQIVAVEALLRWTHPERGRIMPDSFIKIAEETGVIVPLGEWVLRTACQKARQWSSVGVRNLRVSVNVSGVQFKQAGFLESVAGILSETGVDPQYLELELTETTLMENAESTLKSLFSLKELGISIAVDDFGAGYSSLSYLKDFPIDRIKIDRSFIKDVCERPDDKAIVEAMIALAMSLRMYIVAEGVEEAEQLAFLASRNCDEIQGYYFHRPMSEEKLLELLLPAAGEVIHS